MKTYKALLLTILLTLFAPALLRAGGNPEVGLPKVDRLIKERNYNEAILVLADYMGKHPEDFDAAQARIKKIMALREDYNAAANDLLNVIVTEPGNNQKKLEKIAYLEKLEKNPNASAQEFILNTKDASLFAWYQSEFEKIMNQGDSLIDEGQTLAAVRCFSQGLFSVQSLSGAAGTAPGAGTAAAGPASRETLDFYKREFDLENPESLVSAVNARLAALRTAVGELSVALASLNASTAAFETSLPSANADRIEGALGRLESDLSAVTRLRNGVAEAGWFFEDAYAALMKENPSRTENSYLPFAWRFVLGRKTAGRYEGVLGALDARVNADRDRVENGLAGAVKSAWTAALGRFDSLEVAEGKAALASASRLTGMGASFALSAQNIEYRSSTHGQRSFRGTADSFTRIGSAVSSLSALGDLHLGYLSVTGRISAFTGEPPESKAIRDSSSLVVSAYANFAAELASLAVRVRQLGSSVAAGPPIEPYAGDFGAFRDKLDSLIGSSRVDLYRKSAAYQRDSADRLLAEWQDSYAEARRLLSGVTPEGSSSALFYPAEAASAFARIQNGAGRDRKFLAAVVDELERNAGGAASDADYASSVAGMKSVSARLDELLAQAADGADSARRRELQSNLARREADQRYAEAQKALRRDDFQNARDSLQRARDKYSESLALQESPKLRAESDAKLAGLGDEITRVENESVVREVRGLISQGKSFYYLGKFDEAEQRFTSAKTRWNVTNIEPNAEVANWLSIVSNALSMKTGRTIPVSDPLYPQMSQLLNGAGQLFDEGKRLMAAGSRDAARSSLEAAREKIRQVQLYYPLNQDAGMLALRIDQVLDPALFDRSFGAKIDEIRAKYRSTDRKESQTAYGDLLNLSQINPSYTGIRALLEQVEIYLGIRMKAPDPKDLARSKDLTKKAQSYYDANNRNLFPVALEQLDEAIRLDPENQKAVALKDRIQTSLGGQSVAVLSAEDEAKFNNALQALHEGRNLDAYALVTQLMQNPKNRKSAKIQDLYNRIGIP